MADEYFIGCRIDKRNRQWRWVSDKSISPTYLPWATGEPNGDGNCTTMYKGYTKDYGKYNDLDCTKHYQRPRFICELPFFPLAFIPRGFFFITQLWD